ncbi:protein RICE SALT SENSITIVE 3-like [Hibiscus syriacus]|uniref:protein RICE SALT SENSITIVE 3-like n=1 Tax=Hibiscus syriacus TaxID=106335 RepID=UPI001922E55D|nr:protein RICE SALT SENSITIVE 3-like [Hibiscus syriacus]
MEEHLNPFAVTHLLQHTLRSLCIHDNSQWVYAVFWRILPRNYPPPKWDGQGAYDRSRGNRRNWILVWEDGFCNFAASAAEINSGDCPGSSVHGSGEFQHCQRLQPELFFKMSHEIYNYGEGLIGKVAADHSHKWIYKEPNEKEINFLSAWHNSADSFPRTWEAQFQAGIKTIALIAVREGVVQLGAVHKVIEDLSYVVQLRKFSYIESIPGVLLPHPSSSAYPFNGTLEPWAHFPSGSPIAPPPPPEFYDHFNQPMKITPSMSSLEALLSKLPSVVPPQASPGYCESQPVQSQFLSSQRPVEYNIGIEKVEK